MFRILFVVILFLPIFSFGQADGIVSGKKETVISVKSGNIIIKKEYTMMGSVLKEYSLAVLGTFVLSSDAVLDMVKIGETDSKGKLELVLSKACELVDIRVVSSTSQSEIAQKELEAFASELLVKFKEGNHHHIFQFDNELGFVNEDSCVDNITVSVVFKVQ